MASKVNVSMNEKELKIISKILQIILKLIQTFLKKKYVEGKVDLEKEWNDGKEKTK